MPDPYGLRRVLSPAGAMPQPAERLDNSPVCLDDEVLIDVELLNIDAASFGQIKSVTGADEAAVARHMQALVAARGKHHNPVTGSGGMLIGRVREIGPASSKRGELRPGDRIATLVSLTLTPLAITAIDAVDLQTGQVRISGTAILFDSGICVKLPEDLPERVALAVCDVCGAPAQVARLVKPGQRVAVLGAGGKSGLMVLAQARRNLGASGTLIGFEYAEKAAESVRQLDVADHVVVCDVRDPVATLEHANRITDGALADVAINCVSVLGTELASILITRQRGVVYFFSMATSFSQAALGAEGVGKDVDLMIGNGYAQGHAQLAFDLLRETPKLRQLFVGKVGLA
jgi:L-erythro-3,5-diaminohexanoate dehydrogenase